jgi:hypothetical protein
MLMLHALLHIHVFMLHVRAAYPRFMSMLHEHTA